MTTPTWVLSLAYWIHLVATVAWVGGLAALALIVLPAAGRTLDDRAQAALLESMQSRLDRLGWACLALLIATGLIQMSESDSYNGLLNISNRWATAILFKHIVIALMVGISAYLTWGVLPELRRALLRQARWQSQPPAADREQTSRISRTGLRLLRINLALALLVLALTAVARVS
jgi:uncharacterized membrane protein